MHSAMQRTESLCWCWLNLRGGAYLREDLYEGDNVGRIYILSGIVWACMKKRKSL